MKNKIDINKEFLIICKAPITRQTKFIGLINYDGEEKVLSDSAYTILSNIVSICDNNDIYFVRKRDIQMVCGNFFIVEDGLNSFEVLCNKVEILKFLNEKTGK